MRATIGDGGAAFPGGDTVDSGMTLRDYFAGQVIGALTAASLGRESTAKLNQTCNMAYVIADAMLVERAK